MSGIKLLGRTKKNKLISYPGVFTRMECFSAIEAEADGFKFFTSFFIRSTGYRAIIEVLPISIESYAVGRITASNFLEWLQVGITGFGVCSAFYQVGDLPNYVAKKASKLVKEHVIAVRSSECLA